LGHRTAFWREVWVCPEGVVVRSPPHIRTGSRAVKQVPS
jgi:hypothetical protein